MTETARPKRLHGHSQELFKALTEAGIIHDGDYVRRVIIDINVSQAVVVHVERIGDERLLGLVRNLDGIEIRTGVRHRGVIHLCPPAGQDTTPCCGRTLSDLPRDDRVAQTVNLVTCGLPDVDEWLEEHTVSIYDDGTDLGKPPVPAEETRGGENIDWENARPGEPLPERKPQGEGNEEMTESNPDWAPEPGWGLT